MTIAVDARELAGRATGVGRYLGALLACWGDSADARRHRWRLYVHSRPPTALPGLGSVELLPGRGGTRWEQWTLARALAADRPDVLFAPAYTAPLTAPCPTVVTIHDVSFFADRSGFSAREGLRRRTLTAWSARRARLVLTDSQFSASEIARHIGVRGARVRVIPLGVSRRPSLTPARATREPIVLFVGSIFRRRHVDRLIDAFAEIVAPQVPGSRLEIVGENRLFPPGDPAESLRHHPNIAHRVVLRSYVDDRTLDDLYGRAAVFVFPSDYEGFGLTPLEALSAGVPPIVLDTAISREVYGSAARFVDPDPSDRRHLGDAVAELLTQSEARSRVLAHADAVLARYDWARTAVQTLRAIEEAGVGQGA